MRNYTGIFFAAILVSSAVSASTIVFDHDGDFIAHDRATGHYSIVYRGEDGAERVVDFVPASSVHTTVSSHYHPENGGLRYTYTLSNVASSPLPVFMLEVPVSGASLELSTPPANWEATLREEEQHTLVAWAHDCSQPDRCLLPGTRQSGFGFTSSSLPGIAQVAVVGAAPTLAFPDDGPNAAVYEYLQEQLLAPAKNAAHHFAIVPTFALGNGTNQATLIAAIADHVQQLEHYELLDRALAENLASKLRAASGLADGNPFAAQQALREVRRIVENGQRGKSAQHASEAIPKDVADVLSFNLRYVERRL